jgi:hypothetical protein
VPNRRSKHDERYHRKTKPPFKGKFPLSLAKQIGAMKSRFPQFSVSHGPNKATWTGDLKPTSLSPVYKIEVTYMLRRRPIVIVLEPKLELPPGEDEIPHTYKAVNDLCLYYPRHKEWTADMKIAETIIPWVCDWLFYYEAWLATGEWLGGGINHTGPKRE